MEKLKQRTWAIAVAAALVTGFAAGSLTAENQPHMRAALQTLKTAKNQLQQAQADKGGHRAKAIDLVNSAISEVEKGIAYDNKR